MLRAFSFSDQTVEGLGQLSEDHGPARVHKRMRERRRHQASRISPCTAIKHPGNRSHQKIAVIRDWRSVVEMGSAENNRCRNQTEPGLFCRAFNPILNQSAKKKFFRKRGEEKNSCED